MGNRNQCSTGGDVSLLICNANALVTPDQRFLLRDGSKTVYHGPQFELLFLQNTIFSHSAKFLVLVRSIATISTCETQIRHQTMRENSQKLSPLGVTAITSSRGLRTLAVGLVGKLTEETTPREMEINVLTSGEVSLLMCNANALVTTDQRFLLRHGSKSGYHGPLSELLFLQDTIFSHSAKFLVLVRTIPTISTCEMQTRQQTMRENS
jgi:hypothetical protein